MGTGRAVWLSMGLGGEQGWSLPLTSERSLCCGTSLPLGERAWWRGREEEGTLPCSCYRGHARGSPTCKTGRDGGGSSVTRHFRKRWFMLQHCLWWQVQVLDQVGLAGNPGSALNHCVTLKNAPVWASVSKYPKTGQ